MLYECRNNFLANYAYSEVLKILTDSKFPWYKVYSKNCFEHEFISDEKPVSPYLNIIDNIRDRYKKPIITATAFMIMPMKQEFEILKRIQLFDNNKTFLTLHINNADGRTVLNSLNTSFQSIQNRAVFTNPNLTVSETTPVETGFRIIITCLFKNEL